LPLAQRDQYGRGIFAHSQHHSFAEHVTWQFGPEVRARRGAESEDLICDSRRLVVGFTAAALIAEDAEVVTDLDALGAAQVHVHDRPVVCQLTVVPGRDDHRLGLAAGRRKDIEALFGFDHRSRSGREGQY